MKRIVLDTNVTVSAFFWNGNSRKIYELAKRNKIKILYSKEIEAELIRVLSYKKFGLSPHEIIPLVNDFRKTATLINIKSKIHIIKEDPTDNIFIECAINGKAKYIISGDHHLLEQKKIQGIDILKPKDFLEF